MLLQGNDKYKMLVQENQKTRQVARLGLSKDARESNTDSYILSLYMFKVIFVIFVHSLFSVCHFPGTAPCNGATSWERNEINIYASSLPIKFSV